VGGLRSAQGQEGVLNPHLDGIVQGRAAHNLKAGIGHKPKIHQALAHGAPPVQGHHTAVPAGANVIQRRSFERGLGSATMAPAPVSASAPMSPSGSAAMSVSMALVVTRFGFLLSGALHRVGAARAAPRRRAVSTPAPPE
jgi:hypothetical protein